MATGKYEPIVPWAIEASINISQLPIAYLQESASLNTKKGAPLYFDSSRQLVECAASFAQASFIAQDVSTNSASAGSTLQAWRITPEVIWLVTLNEAFALNLIYNSYGLVKDSTTGNWYLSTANTGNQMMIIGAPDGPGGTSIGDTKSRVLAVFNPGAIQNNVNSFAAGVGAAIASTTTIAPTNAVHHITGTNAIATITVPAGFPDGGRLVLIPDAAFTFTTAGNIAKTATGVVSEAMYLTYDRTAVKWYPSY